MRKIKYLIIAETSDIGYFVEIVEEYELALKREKLFFELAFNPPADRKRMREEFKPLGTYTINDQYAVFFDSIGGTCNGFYSTYIVEIDETFNFEMFSKLRNSSNQISYNEGEKELYDLEEKYGATLTKGIWAN